MTGHAGSTSPTPAILALSNEQMTSLPDAMGASIYGIRTKCHSYQTADIFDVHDEKLIIYVVSIFFSGPRFWN